jgi:hypothetical protein
MTFKNPNISDQPKAKWDIMFPLMMKQFPIMERAGAKLISKAEASVMGGIYVSRYKPENLILVVDAEAVQYTSSWDEVRQYLTDTWRGIKLGLELAESEESKELSKIP